MPTNVRSTVITVMPTHNALTLQDHLHASVAMWLITMETEQHVILSEDLVTQKSLAKTPKKCPSYILGYIPACRIRLTVTGVCVIEPQAMGGEDRHFIATVITVDPQ